MLNTGRFKMKEQISYMYYSKPINLGRMIYMALDRAKNEVSLLYQLVGCYYFPMRNRVNFHYILVI